MQDSIHGYKGLEFGEIRFKGYRYILIYVKGSIIYGLRIMCYRIKVVIWIWT
jgi:hypothetical protein